MHVLVGASLLKFIVRSTKRTARHHSLFELCRIDTGVLRYH